MSAKLQIYKDKRGKWRWRLTANNGKIIASSSEGYANKSDMWDNAELVLCGWCPCD